MAAHTAEELQHMTVKELRELAKELPGITGVHSMKKDELVALLSAGKAGGAAKTAAAPKKAKKPAAEKKPRTKAAIKALLGELRQAKEGAQAAKDKTRIEMLRRRINRLKKQTRKAHQPAAA